MKPAGTFTAYLFRRARRCTPVLLLAVFTLAGSDSLRAQGFVFCSEGSPDGFNAALSTSATTFDATRQIFDQLVDLDYESLDVVPALASSWVVSDDGTSYSFQLRDDVAFQSNDGFQPTRRFNAEDVLFSFRRQLDPENPYYQVAGGRNIVFQALGLDRLIESIEKLDDHKVRFRLRRPDASFLAALTMDFAAILSAEYADQLLANDTPEKIDQAPIGTGPFTLAGYQTDSFIRYRAFADHWRGKPGIATLIFDITVDPSTRYLKLRSGECHLIAYPNPAQIADMKADPDIAVQSWPGFNVGYLAFNSEKAPFQDPRVRRALSHAIDKEAIMSVIYAGTAVSAKSPVPPVSWAYDDELQAIPQDIEKAKALLAEAGLAEGFATTIWAMPVQRPYNPNARRMAELIQADWAKIGVRAEIVSYEWAEYLRRARLGEHDTILLGWAGGNGDPDDLLTPLLGCAEGAPGGLNRAFWCDETFDGYLAAARETRDRARRKALYGKAQGLLQQEAPWLPIAHAQVIEAVREEVQGYQGNAFGRHFFSGVTLGGGE